MCNGRANVWRRGVLAPCEEPAKPERVPRATPALDERCGTLDRGTGYLKDSDDRIVAEISATGVCTGHSGTYLGEFENFGYRNMVAIALYLMLIDPGMLNEVEG